MLSARLRLGDLDGRPWRWQDDRWIRGGSLIKPLAHPCLTHAAYADVGRVRMIVRERPGADENAAAEIAAVEVRPGTVTLTMGQYGTAPLYVAASGEFLEVTWDVASVAHHARVDYLHDVVIARLLTRRHRYSVDTAFRTIKRLTERTVTTFNDSGLYIEYPTATERVARPRRLRPDVHPVQALDDLLRRASNRLALPSGEVGVELSGGIDSANVAATVSALSGPLPACGVVFDGGLGMAQQERRNEVVARLGLVDIPVEASRHPPFAPGGPRGLVLSAHDPDSDFYREAFGAAAIAARQAGVRVLFTGFGGDEIMALRADERAAPFTAPLLPPWLGPRAHDALSYVDDSIAPPSPVPVSTLMALAARGPALIQHGIWPIAPMSDPRLVRFGDSLPVEWRRDKRILRDRLGALGFPAHVVRPRVPENFLSLMERGLRDNGLAWIRRMLDGESILIEGAFVDRAALAVAYHEARASPQIPDLLYDTIAVEVGLRSLTERSKGSQDARRP